MIDTILRGVVGFAVGLGMAHVAQRLGLSLPFYIAGLTAVYFMDGRRHE